MLFVNVLVVRLSMMLCQQVLIADRLATEQSALSEQRAGVDKPYTSDLPQHSDQLYYQTDLGDASSWDVVGDLVRKAQADSHLVHSEDEVPASEWTDSAYESAPISATFSHHDQGCVKQYANMNLPHMSCIC